MLIGGTSFEGSEKQGVAFVLDLTERERAEAEVRASQQRYHQAQMELAHANRVAIVGHLTASIAHEVKQPVAATVANAKAALRWLDRGPPDLEEVRQALARIVKDGNRSAEVIDRIRALIKRESPQRDRLKMNQAIREVIELTRSEAARNDVSVHAELPNGLPLVEGDRIQLQQVILNLMMNAIEAMSTSHQAPRELQISTETDASGNLKVVVRDSGPGLNPKSVDRLFEAFYTTKPGGIGMGLAICRSIIEAHGGQLWANANEPRGAVFEFTLPTRGREIVRAERPGPTQVM